MVNKALGGITAASLLTAGGAVVGGLEHLDGRYAPAGEYVALSEFQDLSANMAIGQFYDRLDDLHESQDENNHELAARYMEELERLLTEICEHKPTFRYCSESIQ